MSMYDDLAINDLCKRINFLETKLKDIEDVIKSHRTPTAEMKFKRIKEIMLRDQFLDETDLKRRRP